MEELQELQLAFLPDHQRGDIAERRDDAARIGGHHDDDAAHDDELVIADSDGHHHRAHDERRGQIVDDRTEDERKPPDQPEKLPIGEPPVDESGPQHVEDAPLLHRVHIRDRHHEEQHQLAIVEDHMLGGGFERGTLPVHGIDDAEQRPDEASRQHDGLRLAQLNDFLDGHESVGSEEDQERQKADGMLRQIDARRRLPRHGEAQESRRSKANAGMAGIHSRPAKRNIVSPPLRELNASVTAPDRADRICAEQKDPMKEMAWVIHLTLAASRHKGAS